MDEIGLYYPYFHVRDDTWLKAAALYLPRLARVRPPEYPIRDSDSPTAAVLRDELGFLCEVDPTPQAELVAREFEAFVRREEVALRERYRVDSSGRRRGFGAEIGDPWLLDETRFAWIHRSQLPLHFEPDHDLAIHTRFDPLTGVRDEGWVGMDPRLVATYSYVLAERIARANSLSLVTDDPSLLALPSNCTFNDLGALLLEGIQPATPSGNSKVAVLYACAAIHTVVPRDLKHVPVEKIVHARQALADEFEAFRAHMDALSEELADLRWVEDPGILQLRLESMVERELMAPSRDLERGLRSLRMEPVRAVFGLKSLELPAIAALAANALSLSPIMAAGGAIAVQLMTSVHSARSMAHEQKNSAAGYLLGLGRELAPTTVLARARRRGPTGT